MEKKGVFLLGSLIALVALINAEPFGFFGSPWSHVNNLIAGARAPGDHLVCRQSVVKRSMWMHVINHRQMFKAGKFQRITQVKALDQKRNGKGATVWIISGGRGCNNVTLGFRSARGHGINYVVELYGRF